MIDWAVMFLIAGSIIMFIASLPQKQVGGAAHVIDGDSLTIAHQEIRLHGIDAPEFDQVCRNVEGAEYRCGRMAARALKRLIEGRKIDCVVVTTDRYGRNVSRCSQSGQDINEELVRQGWAIAYRNHSSDFTEAEREARQAGRGMWQGKFDRPRDWRNNRGIASDTLGQKLPVD